MTTDIDPLDLAGLDARRLRAKVKKAIGDAIRTHATLGLMKVSLGGLIAAVLAVIGLPWLAGGVAAAAIGALIIHAYYATQIIRRKDSEVRWQTIENIRLRQKVLELEDAGDCAAVALLQGRAALMQVRPVELRQVLGYLRAAYIHENASDGAPTIRQRPAPQPPDLSKVQHRIAIRAAELAEGEARVQSLSVPEAVDLLLAAEDATRSKGAAPSRRAGGRPCRTRELPSRHDPVAPQSRP